MPNIGEVIRYIREENGYTQGDVAEWSGVYRKTVGEIERTGRGTITNIEKILGALGYELEVVPINGRD
ncbi:MAG: helix-turn-helix domain-containing protein [Aeriscardovia sp.]|nr:helix-turn-helix domain-containing protein [Aeriscardovia sp.]